MVLVGLSTGGELLLLVLSLVLLADLGPQVGLKGESLFAGADDPGLLALAEGVEEQLLLRGELGRECGDVGHGLLVTDSGLAKFGRLGRDVPVSGLDLDAEICEPEGLVLGLGLEVPDGGGGDVDLDGAGVQLLLEFGNEVFLGLCLFGGLEACLFALGDGDTETVNLPVLLGDQGRRLVFGAARAGLLVL